MFYELWDVKSGNIINTYDTEDEALTIVRDLVAINGPEYAVALALGLEDDEENTTLVAKGAELARRAQHATPGVQDQVTHTPTTPTRISVRPS